jgi:hypothetical protein
LIILEKFSYNAEVWNVIESYKVNFGVTQGKLLGHIVFDSGISIDPERVTTIQNLQAPTSKKEIQSFMGKINFVRRFIPNFARMVKPIHNMLKQDRSFSWNDDTEKYFVEVKKAISSAPVLAKPNFEKYFIIYTNATEEAISVILLQKDDQNNDQPIAYMSQSLSDDEFKYTLIEKHTYALVKAIEKFHHYILGKHTQVKVPLPAVKFFLSQTHLSGKLAHWLAKIQEHDFTITTSHTIKGRDLALHLAQHLEPGVTSENDEDALSALFLVETENIELAEHPWYKDIIYYLQFQKCPNNLENYQHRRIHLKPLNI